MKRKIVCDFKSVEKVEQMFTLKMYNLTNFMLMSKNEEIAYFFHFLTKTFFR
jgi:hypothetical protein